MTGFKTKEAIRHITDYYRNDYEMIMDILSCRWSEVLVLGLRRFGKTSLLNRIEGFVNKPEEYREFLEKGLENWDMARDGNPPSKEFFEEMKTLNGIALQISFLDEIERCEEKTIFFFRQISGLKKYNKISFEGIADSLPPKVFILMDEFSELSGQSAQCERKREFFLKLYKSARNIVSKDIVFIISEPPSIFSVFEGYNSLNPTINDIAEAIQSRKLFELNGLSPQEKHDLFCLRKTHNYGANSDQSKIRSLLDRISGIPLEVQYAGEIYFRNPERDLEDILKEIIKSFGGVVKGSIIKTMNSRQKVLIRLVTECEKTGELNIQHLSKNGVELFHELKNFGLLTKNDAGNIKFSSEPIRYILCVELQEMSAIVEDEIYHRELKNVYIPQEENGTKKMSLANNWDGKIRIHHLSDLALGALVVNCKYDEDSPMELTLLNKGNNPFKAYLEYIKLPSNRPHIIVFSGDIAQDDHKYYYKGLKEFINEVQKNINPLPGETNFIPKKQILLVPGEMDIFKYKEEGCKTKEDLKKLDKECFHYFFNEFKDYALPQENPSENSLENGISIEIPSIQREPGYKLQFLLFNSATMEWDKNHNKKRWEFLKDLKGYIHGGNSEKIKEALDHLIGEEIGIINLDGIEKDKCKIGINNEILRIAVTHHNLNPYEVRKNATSYTVDTLNAFDAKKTLLLNQFGVILHGHQRKPIFIKEKLYEKEVPYLKTILMNGAGRFTDTEHGVDSEGFSPSFNCYVIQKLSSNGNDMATTPMGNFGLTSFVCTYHKDDSKFIDEMPIQEKILTSGD
ncbi:MAG: hypothetical protein ACM3SY_11870 [Candidatus Omnitrophota bacterium]